MTSQPGPAQTDHPDESVSAFNPGNPDVRHVVLVLDVSGSMQTTRSDAEGGVKAFLEKQQEAPGLTLVTMYEFSSVFEQVHGPAPDRVPVHRMPLDQVPPWALVPRGMTALYDAMANAATITMAHDRKLAGGELPGETILVVVTDGHENSSVEYGIGLNGAVRVRELLEKWQAEGRAVLFLAADQDAVLTGKDLGVPASTSMSYDSRVGTHAVFAAAGEATTRGSRLKSAPGGQSVSSAEAYGFTQEERDTASGLGEPDNES